VEDILAVRPVRVHIRFPAGPGTHPMVHKHRAVTGLIRRPHTVDGRVLFLVPVVRHHEDIQDLRRGEPRVPVVLVYRVLGRRVSVRVFLRT